jgi:hypothetical protein
MRMEQTTTVAHILDGSSRSVGNFKRAVFADLGSPEVGLK